MNDLRFAIRQLLKSPGFTVVAVLTLSLGVGVNTTMFTALQEVMLRPLRYPDADRLVQLIATSPRSQHETHHSAANFLDYKTQGREFEFVAAMNGKPFNLAEAGQPAERVEGLHVSADFFPLLGMQPELGRVFTADEDHPGRNNVAILDNGFWLRRFRGDPSIIGRVIRLDGESVTVVGVMPARFRDIMLAGPVSLWRPIALTDDQRANRGGSYLKCIARLKPGVRLTQAIAGMNVLAGRLAHDYPDNDSAMGLRVVPLAESSLPPEGRRIVWLAMSLAGFVLLIACANLANLQFARSAARSRELAIRGALGASRGRLIRQLLVENVLLALLGGFFGLGMANWGNLLMSRQFQMDGVTVLALSLNLRVLGFALVASTLSGMAFGLLPAWMASRTDVNETLKQGSRGSTGDRSQHRWQQSLIVAEVALALVLLSGAGLVVKGLNEYAKMQPGWTVDGLTIGTLSLPEAKYADGNALRAFASQLQEKLAALPGAESVALCWNIPLRQFNVTSSFFIKGRPEPPKGHEPRRFITGVTPAYFKTMGMRVLEGREFGKADTITSPAVVIINETMARAFWPGESAIGKRVDAEEIVGVVGDVRFPANPGEFRTAFQTYRPFFQEPRHMLAMVIRGNIPADTLRRAIAQLDADQPVGEAGSARAAIGKSLDNWDVGGKVLTCFAALGLLLASLGIYGVLAGFVVRRANEIGVRMALGAQLGDVVWLVLGKGLRLTMLGAGIGLAGGFGITRLIASITPGLPANDPLMITAVSVLLVTVAMIACWLPARRASRVDPMVALRSE